MDTNGSDRAAQTSCLCEESRRNLAFIAGILIAVGFLFLLFHTAMTYKDQAGSGQRLAVALVGVIASGAVLVVACVVRGLAAGIALAGLGVFLLVLPPAFLGEACPIPGHSGITGLSVFGLVLLALMLGAMYARRADTESPVTRWVLCGIAAAAMILQAVSGLILLGGETASAKELGQLLGTAEVLPLITFIWMTLAVWALLVLGLVNALSERNIEKTATSGLILARVVMWSLLALTVTGFVLAIKGIAADAPAGTVGRLVSGFIGGIITGMVPLFAAAHLAAGSFASALSAIEHAANPAGKKASDAPGTRPS